MTLKEILTLVQPYVYLSGSYARGEERDNSDIDFYVPEKNWKKLKSILPSGWESVIVGHVGYRNFDGKMLDFSTMFPRYKKFKSREIFGVMFRC